MSKRRNRATYRTNPRALAFMLIMRGLTIKRAAQILNFSRRAVEQMARTETPITFKTACKLRRHFGRSVVIDETESSVAREQWQ